MPGFFKKRKNYKEREIAPDEIFLDAKNIPNFDTGRLEGRLPLLIKPKISYFVFFSFLIIVFVIFGRVSYLQIIKGEEMAKRAELNSLQKITIPSERGLIYDRFSKKLAWNIPSFQIIIDPEKLNDDKEIFAYLQENFGIKKDKITAGEKIILGDFTDWTEIEGILRKFQNFDGSIDITNSTLRKYAEIDGLSHVLGYVGYSDKDKIKIGKAGVEKIFDNYLRGRDGVKLKEKTSRGEIVSESIIARPQKGKNIKLTIDAGLQNALYKSIEEVASISNFKGGAGVILDINTGEVMAITSFPEYDSDVLSQGRPVALVNKLLNDPDYPFFFRAVEGLYSPGSTFKPLIAIAALNENIIEPTKKILSTGSISLPNPYNPQLKNTFYDWKAHGWVDMKDALAYSSNVYFYEIGGGFEDQPGLGISKIKKYAKMFQLDKKTGFEFNEAESLIPGPEWKKEHNADDPVWRIGDTYNVSIGQGAIRVTPLQMAKFIAAVASEGNLITPHIVKNDNIENQKLELDRQSFKIVKKGLEGAVNYGTAAGLSGMDIKVAGKTGTAELGPKDLVNSWFIGYFPSDNPKFAIAIVMEKRESRSLIGAVYAARQTIQWLAENRKNEYNL